MIGLRSYADTCVRFSCHCYRFVAKAGVHKMRIQNVVQLDKVIAKAREVAGVLGLPIEVGDTTDLRAMLNDDSNNNINAEITDTRVILNGECFFVKVFLKQIRHCHVW